ncbi:alpha/beta fold hydrolase [Variovorax terrae]|uniref:Alpha/beta fold hydrolase n=1 Tax=Variovorax terrae TaxID=2923278 RepID=A0A9X1VVX8_9BURK|nr:alpha/beta fold hydrolase [Variovorax terrae]MCJ0763950.1 alpha/beta fold hydrolase [Variovorax terrae]
MRALEETPVLPVEIQRLAQSAERLETPCGAGSLVWHAWGEGDGRHPPVVLLHGGSGSWTHWLRNIEPLATAGRRVLAADLPGFGDSAPPAAGRDADALVEPLQAGLQQLLGDAACDLVGFSFGGMVAGLWAERFSARARRLVIVGAPGLGVVPRGTVPLSGWRHLQDPTARDAVHRQNLAALMLHQPASITELALRLHAANVVRDRMPGRRLAHTDVLARALDQVACPVHAIYGREDALYRERLDALAQVLRSKPCVRELTLIDGAGHWVQFEAAAAFNALLLRLLAAPGG